MHVTGMSLVIDNLNLGMCKGWVSMQKKKKKKKYNPKGEVANF